MNQTFDYKQATKSLREFAELPPEALLAVVCSDPLALNLSKALDAALKEAGAAGLSSTGGLVTLASALGFYVGRGVAIAPGDGAHEAMAAMLDLLSKIINFSATDASMGESNARN